MMSQMKSGVQYEFYCRNSVAVVAAALGRITAERSVEYSGFWQPVVLGETCRKSSERGKQFSNDFDGGAGQDFGKRFGAN